MPGVDKQKLEKFRSGELRFTQIFDLSADQIASLLLCAHNYYSQGRLETARNILEGLSVLDPLNPYLHSLLGAIHQKMENHETAIARYSCAIQLFPGDIASMTNRAEIYLKIGRFQEAANDLKKAIELGTNNNHPAANRARALISIATESLMSAQKSKPS